MQIIYINIYEIYLILLSLYLQKEFEELNEKYGKLLGGNLSIEEFWKMLFPFVTTLLTSQEFKENREKIGQVSISSLNNLFINLRDKKQSYFENKDLGDKQQSRISENNFISTSTEMMEKLGQIISKLNDDKKISQTANPPSMNKFQYENKNTFVAERDENVDNLDKTKILSPEGNFIDPIKEKQWVGLLSLIVEKNCIPFIGEEIPSKWIPTSNDISLD